MNTLLFTGDKGTSPRFRNRQRGVSLIDLMVGITIGLMVVLAALGAATQTTVGSTAVSDTLRMTMESQQLFDVMGRHLRQAGSSTLSQPGEAGIVTLQSGQDAGTHPIQQVGANLVIRHGTQVPVAVPVNAPSLQVTNCLGAVENTPTAVNTFSLNAATKELRCNPGNGAQPLGENVEGITYRYGSRDQAGNLNYLRAVDVAATDWALVESVEVCLQLRGEATNTPSSLGSYTDCTNRVVTPKDGRLHRVYRRVLSVRPDPRGGM